MHMSLTIRKSLLLALIVSSVFLSGGRHAVAAETTYWVQAQDYTETCSGSGDSYSCTYALSNPPTYTTIGTFYASDGGASVNTYPPGGLVTVNLAAVTGVGDPNTRGLNSIWCLFGCGSSPLIEEGANPPGIVSCSGHGSCSGTATFRAQSNPGRQTVSVGGCVDSASYCSGSSFEIIVASPPSVLLQFSFLDKVKSIISNPEHLFGGLGKSYRG